MANEQVFREVRSGVLFEVVKVRTLSKGECAASCRPWPEASVTLRHVDASAEVRHVYASILCGADTASGEAWERIPDDDGETVLWGGGTKVGPVGAVA